MMIGSMIYFAGAFALLLGGLYWRRASSTGAFLALLAGSMAIIGLEPVQDGFTALAKLAFPASKIVVDIPSARVGLISIGATVLAMIVGSLLFPDKKPATDDEHSELDTEEGGQ